MRRAATRDLISKRTRNAFREFLVGWSVGDIRMLFEEVGIFPDLNHDPPERGDRRRFVEQHYHTLDVREPATARRLVSAYAEMLQRVIAKTGLSDSTTQLVAALINRSKESQLGTAPFTALCDQSFKDSNSDRMSGRIGSLRMSSW